jgi:hypothetical protein
MGVVRRSVPSSGSATQQSAFKGVEVCLGKKSVFLADPAVPIDTNHIELSGFICIGGGG